jgi:hypothetical protein
MDTFHKLSLHSNGVTGFQSTSGPKGTYELVDSFTEPEAPAVKLDKNIDSVEKRHITVSRPAYFLRTGKSVRLTFSGSN